MGAEALMRWVPGDDGVPRVPSAFFPELRRLGLLAEWDRYVRDVVGRDIREFQRHHRGFFVSINLQPHDLMLPDVIDHLLAWPQMHNIPARSLHLEVVEDMRLPEQADQVVRQLAAAGFSLGIDDFGSGFAGFPYLERLPLTHLKIDRHLVSDCDQHPHHARLIQGVTALAHALGLVVIAEGVESPATVRLLQDLGVDAAQGYALGRPMDRQAFMAWLMMGATLTEAGA